MESSATHTLSTQTQGAPLAKYAASRRVGDYIFLSGVIAVDPQNKVIVNGFDDIPAEAAQLIGQTGEFSTDYKIGPILAQSWYVLNAIRGHIEAQGGQMSDVFKLVQYFRNVDHFPYYSQVRQLFFPDQAPVSTVVEVSAMMPSKAILIEVEATAYLPLS
ncbi:Enamine deaminase RidA, house cleaning of reactive enamine intermediates, YjgF/YER057c/UK114 family [Vibrio xiamenensis]|uniref:Enamine deaminase RidA, house cleaning of reactive enamine intermediates, YjgF/YER057c/UK114 family n=1 Tax=Vibrio xiamenensis TaxID=861298 RepID=A0A1G7WVD9_9VIBR|nr:RidA family protein [Vibrio xiamenensis]SDG75869.1 Enamine deaminase RidA, house cleaning of reactive enamine intermediates, YjgF/YER057c/UK114 family [Vibrio xiamenensis]